MPHERIAVFDLDDTLIDAKIEVYNYFKVAYPQLSHWSEWNTYSIQAELGITDEEFIAFSLKHDIFLKAKPAASAVPLLKELKSDGYRVVIVTARGGFLPDAYNLTSKYLEKADLYYDELIISDYGTNKMNYLEEYDTIDFAVDDHIRNCDDFDNSGKVEQVFLAAQQHNANCDKYVRLHNLYQVYYYLGVH